MVAFHCDRILSRQKRTNSQYCNTETILELKTFFFFKKKIFFLRKKNTGTKFNKINFNIKTVLDPLH